MENVKNQNNKLNRKDLFIYSTSLIFEQDINKLWYFLNDFKNEVELIDYLDNFQYINGNNTWILGNQFSINWIGLTRLEIKCVKIETNLNKKIIKWKEKGDIGINFYKTVNLYRITQNDKTLVKVIISKTEQNNKLITVTDAMKKYYSNLLFNILLSESNFLQNKQEDIISYDSCIINQNYKIIWEFITDLKKVSEITPIIGSKIEYNGSIMKVGTFIKFFWEKLKLTTFIKVIGIEMPKKKKTWIYKLEYIGTYISPLPNYYECKVIIINNNKTHLSFMHRFPYNTNQEFIKDFNNKKRELLNKNKNYLESINEK